MSALKKYSKFKSKCCWVTLGVSLLVLNWYLFVRNANCPKTPISRPEEKRGDPRATIPLISSNYNEGPVSTLFLLCDGMLKSSPYPLNLSLALA